MGISPCASGPWLKRAGRHFAVPVGIHQCWEVVCFPLAAFHAPLPASRLAPGGFPVAPHAQVSPCPSLAAAGGRGAAAQFVMQVQPANC